MNKEVKFFIIDKDDASVSIIENYLGDIQYDFELKNLSDISNAIISDENLNIFIIDVSENTDLFVEQIDNFEKTHKNCKFILMSYEFKTDYIVKFLRKSKKDFIEKPITRSYFLEIINEIISKLTSEQDFSGQGKVIAIYSNKGGLGKTTVAVNLAYELGYMNKKDKTALVDMNMFLGDVTTFLDLTPAYDMNYIAEKAENKEEILELTTQYSDSNLFVIADSPYREFSNNISKDKIVHLFNALRKIYKYIVVDCSSAITQKTKYVLDFADLILLVSEANLPTLRNCKKCLDFFEKTGILNKTELVLNRYAADDECHAEDVETVLKKKIVVTLPNDWYSVTDSINRGLTISECFPEVRVHDAYIELAEFVSDKLCR